MSCGLLACTQPVLTARCALVDLPQAMMYGNLFCEFILDESLFTWSLLISLHGIPYILTTDTTPVHKIKHFKK